MLTNRSLRPAPDEQLDRRRRAAPGRRPVRARPSPDQGRLGPLLQHDQRVVQVDPPSAEQADQAEQRGLDLHPLRDVEQRPAGPERRVQGREGVGRRVRRPRSAGSARAARDAPSTAVARSTKTAPPSLAGSAVRVGDGVDLLDPGRVVRARAPPRAGASAARASADGSRRIGRGEGVELQAADVGPPPLLVAEVGQGAAWNVANASRRRSSSQAGSSRPLQERLEGRLGEAAGRGGGAGRGCAAHRMVDLT